MQKNKKRDTVSVLLQVPRDVYTEYLKTLDARNLKRLGYNKDVFVKAIKKEIEEFNQAK